MKKDASFPRFALRYKKCSVLFKQGDPCEGAIMLLQGKVALSTGLDTDRRLQVCYCDEGAILGLAETLTGDIHETTAVAATDIVVQFIPHSDVVAMVSDTSSRGMQVVLKLAEQLENLQKTQKLLAHFPSTVREKAIC